MKTIGEMLDEKLARDTREYLDTLPPEEDDFADRVDRMIADMKKEAKNEL